jgi:hypothetical protein
MRECKHKLSASSRDLVGQTQHPMTGFSGTNDARYLLPEGIVYGSLDSEAHTNAQPLELLLQDENEVIIPYHATGGL